MKPQQFLWLAPAATCLVAMIVYVSLRPDAFIIGLLLVPISLLAAVALGVVAVARKSSGAGSATACAVALAAVIPALLVLGKPLRNETFFVLWSLSHKQEMLEAKRSDRVLQHWDSWGFVTMDNDTFLVSDADDELSAAVVPHHSPTLPEPQAGVAARWGKSHRLRCDIVWVDRVHRGFYVVTTADRCLL
jgi:hypothetical protein